MGREMDRQTQKTTKEIGVGGGGGERERESENQVENIQGVKGEAESQRWKGR